MRTKKFTVTAINPDTNKPETFQFDYETYNFESITAQAEYSARVHNRWYSNTEEAIIDLANYYMRTIDKGFWSIVNVMDD